MQYELHATVSLFNHIIVIICSFYPPMPPTKYRKTIVHVSEPTFSNLYDIQNGIPYMYLLITYILFLLSLYERSSRPFSSKVWFSRLVGWIMIDNSSRYWMFSTAFPLIAGTFGPIANAFSLLALVSPWRLYIPPGNTEAQGNPVPDPIWWVD